MSNLYKQAIKIIISGSYNTNDVIQYVAMNHPSIFLKAACPKPAPSLKEKLIEILGVNLTNEQYFDVVKVKKDYNNGWIGKIPAIKAARTVSNCGLKEAKDFIESDFSGASS